MSQQTQRRIANLFVAAFSLVVASRCSVYSDSLLGRDELTVGGAATMTHAGSSGTSAAGTAGHSGTAGKTEGGAANSSTGGLEEMAGAIESGGAETSGGSAGTVSMGGANGGTGGVVGGSPGAGGVAGSGQTATGCAKLSVPLDDASDKAHFVISLASPADLSGATISMRFYVQAGQGGTIFNYVQDSGAFRFLGVPEAKRQPLASASGWSTVSWNVGTEPDTAGTGIVKTSIKSLGIEINALPSSTWSDPTIVYVDSLTVVSPALSFTFDAATSVSTSNTSGALWLNPNASDTTATGTAVTWQGTCP